jgi:hypothetical protein
MTTTTMAYYFILWQLLKMNDYCKRPAAWTQRPDNMYMQLNILNISEIYTIFSGLQSIRRTHTLRKYFRKKPSTPLKCKNWASFSRKDKTFWEELIHLFSYISHLFEVLEHNLMELNLSELTLTALNSI